MVLRFLIRLYNYYLSPDRNFTRRLRSILGFTPINLSIFKLAFYHKSTSNEKLQSIQSNERLEYLGDAILGTIVAEYLFKKYPNSNEGFLTKMRSKIVKRSSLNKIADKMGLDVFLAHYNNTRLSRSMLGNALEALVGAIYLECGYRGTRDYVIQKILRGYLDIHELESFDDNYKSQLLEWCQKNGQSVAYKMLAKYKYEKRDRFKVAVLIDGEKLATADDFNKKSAEQTASEKALRMLGIIDDTDNNDVDNKKTHRKASRQNRSGRQNDSDKPNNRQNKPKRTQKNKPIKKESGQPSPPKQKGNAAQTNEHNEQHKSNRTNDSQQKEPKVKKGNQHATASENKQKPSKKGQQCSSRSKKRSEGPKNQKTQAPKERTTPAPIVEMDDVEEITVDVNISKEADISLANNNKSDKSTPVPNQMKDQKKRGE